MQAAAPKTYISRRMLDRYSEQRRQQQSVQQTGNTAPATGKEFAEDNAATSLPAANSNLAPIEEEKKEIEQTDQAVVEQQQQLVAPAEAKKKRKNSIDRNLSCDELDSDELDGDLNLSDEEPNARSGLRERSNVEQKAEREAYAIEFDTNVFRVSLDCLQHKGQLVTGDAEFCSQCKAVFNKTSKLVEEEGKQIWNCEFCNTRNEVVIDAEEVPQSAEVTYLLEAAAQVEQAEEEKKTEAETVKASDKISIVFCIDISGSMRSDNRLGAAKQAIAAQINTMFESNGQRKLGLVAFDSEIEIIGDGVEKPTKIDTCKMNDYDHILELGKANGVERMRQPISETKDSLLARVASLQTKSTTALGPAVLTSVAMASQGAPGSQVIVLTDGMANVGLGSFNRGNEDANEFYNRLGQLAEQTGVMINLVTIAGAEANIAGLQRMVELSGGQIEQVNPREMKDDFAAILSQTAIATKVEAKVKLHKGLQFRNELETDLSQDKTVLTRRFGNVTTDTMFTFEYGMKPISVLLEMADFDMASITQFPFQTQIVYTDLSGAKCLRVISQSLEVSNEREELANQADADLVQQNCVMQGSKQARAGNTRKAQAIMKNFQRKTKGMQGDQWTSNRADFQAQASEAYSAMNMQQAQMKAPPQMQQMQQMSQVPDSSGPRRKMKERSAPQMQQMQQMDAASLGMPQQMQQQQQQPMQMNDRLTSQMYQMSTKAKRSKY